MAFISEIKYGGNGEGAGDEFIEVTLLPGEDPADFVLSLYDADGTLRANTSSFFASGEFSMQDVIDAVGGNPGSSPSGVGGLDLQVLTHPDNPDATLFVIPVSISRNTTNRNAEAAALTDVSTGTVLDAYDFGAGSNSGTFTEGAAAGATPVATSNANINNSVQFDPAGNSIVTTPDPTTSVICYCDGTLIETLDGSVTAVENLSPRDVLATADGRYLPLRQAFKRIVPVEEMLAHPNLRPVRIRQGALGDGLPTRDLWVSRQHRFVVRSSIVQRMFDRAEVFVAAHQLTALDGVDVVMPKSPITYWHLLLDEHAVIIANGTPAESLFVGTYWLSQHDTVDVIDFSDFTGTLRSSQMARLVPPAPRQRRLIMRHQKNNKPLVSPAARQTAAPRQTPLATAIVKAT